jgi:hypothetical protein
MTVNERARAIATFRFIEVRLMEIVAAWTPTTPEMEVKVLFGRHIWDFAQHADALGKRTFELRLPLHHRLVPIDAYVELLGEMAALSETAARLASLYDVVLPGLERRYRQYVEQTDALMDAPSVVILERILLDSAGQRADADRLRAELGLPAWPAQRLRLKDESAGALVAAGT